MLQRDLHYLLPEHCPESIHLYGQKSGILSVSFAASSLNPLRLGMDYFTLRHAQEDGHHQKLSDVQLFSFVIIVQFHFARVLALIYFTVLNLEENEFWDCFICFIFFYFISCLYHSQNAWFHWRHLELIFLVWVLALLAAHPYYSYCW